MYTNDEARVSAALEALEIFQQQTTIAVICEAPVQSYLLGSGALLAVNGRHFVITAAHLFEDLASLDDVRLPEGRHGETPTAIGEHKLTISDRSPFDFDIAIIELLDEDKIKRIKTHWQFMDVSQIALPTENDIICLGGFPEQFVGFKSGGSEAFMYVARTFILEGTPVGAADVDHRYDIFGQYDTQGEIRQLKRTAETPKLQGVSGGTLMQYLPLKDEGGLWSASRTLKFVGVQSAGSTLRKWFRAKNWHAIVVAFEKHDPELSAVLQKQL